VEKEKEARPSTWNWESIRWLDTEFFLRQWPCSKQARAESCDQHGRESTKSIGISQVESSRKIVDYSIKSIESIDKTA